MLLLDIMLFKGIVISLFMRSANKHLGFSGYFVPLKFNFLFLLAQLHIFKESWQVDSERIYLGREDVMALNFNDILGI